MSRLAPSARLGGVAPVGGHAHGLQEVVEAGRGGGGSRARRPGAYVLLVPVPLGIPHHLKLNANTEASDARHAMPAHAAPNSLSAVS